ncbi:hypothetical protein [Streptomyces smyrnaeus]|nr:hypothetical protein [Streptomyces smyrnaeus]
MAIPGAQPQQPHSQRPTSAAMPAYQVNPYAQPQTPPPGQPGPPGGPGRGGGPRWLWALGGVMVASVTWAATLMATGALDKGATDSAAADAAAPASATPVYKGYRFHHDMCETAELAAFERKYEIQSPTLDDPDGYSSRQKGLDVSSCHRTLLKRGEKSTTPVTTSVTTTVTWHKKADPAGEFASQQRTWKDQGAGSSAYQVSPVSGFGDEAYLVEAKGGDRVMLEVRAGWMTYEMSWSWWGAGLGKEKKPPSKSTVIGWLKEDTRAALKALKKPDSKEAPGRDPST